MNFTRHLPRFLILAGLLAAGLQGTRAAATEETTAETTQAPASAADRLKQEAAELGDQAFTASGYKPGIVRHIVIFRYTATTTAAQKQEIARRFLALRNSRRNGRRYILSIETGGQISGEGVDQNFEQAFIVSFRSQGDRNFYVGQPVVTDAAFYDPNHQRFKDFVGPFLDTNPLGVLVFDLQK